MDNRTLGNHFEQDFCEILFDNGFWTHNMAQNQSGQPADVIAVKNHKAYLIDCKVCSGKGFPLDRIEPNQDTAMDLWRDCGNGEGWFALRIEGHEDIMMIPHFNMKAYRNDPYRKSKTLSLEEIHESGVPLCKWLKKK